MNMTLEELNEHLQRLTAWREAKDRLEELQAQILSAHRIDGLPAHKKQPDKIGDIIIALDLQEREVMRLERGLKKEEKAILRYAKTIPENRTKLIVLLRFFAGLTWSEVGQMLGITEETAKMACYRFFQSKKELP